MGYYQFTITVPDRSRDAVIHRVHEMGCLGATEHPRELVVYFKDTHDIVGLRDGLTSFKSVLRESGLDHDFSFDYFYLSERDWNESWKKRFVPIYIGDSLAVLPPWESRDNGRINIIVDPGMAFGTGHHETTKTCLMLMERLRSAVDRGRFLDIGTGTGILAIAASRLGFRAVTGVDIDALAVDAATRNVDLNGFHNIEIAEGDVGAVKGVFDMIVANLMSDVLIMIAQEIASHLDSRGIVILSGMLVGQEDDVLKALENSGLRMIERLVDGRWVSLVARHNGDTVQNE